MMMKLVPILSLLILLAGMTLVGYAGTTVVTGGEAGSERPACPTHQVTVTPDTSEPTLAGTVQYSQLSNAESFWFQVALQSSPANATEPVFANETTRVRYNGTIHSVDRTLFNQSNCSVPEPETEGVTAFVSLFAGLLLGGGGAVGLIRYYHLNA